MTDSQPPLRRIDRVTGADYLVDVGSKTVSELRAMRDECGQEEARLSYQRRLLHGQLDITKAELARRDSGETASVLATLGRTLADKSSGATRRSAANAPVYTPETADHSRRDDEVLDQMLLGRLPDLDDDELIAVVTRVAEEEKAVSALRRKLLDHLDTLQQLMVARYRDGAASVDDIIPRGTP